LSVKYFPGIVKGEFHFFGFDKLDGTLIRINDCIEFLYIDLFSF